jgi:peptidoglycan/xylan/chitin deacetylase (PgdA/CDA1 family)
MSAGFGPDDDLEPFDPQPVGRNRLRDGRLAAALGGVLVVLIVAALLAGGFVDLPGTAIGPTASPGATAGSPTPSEPLPSPTPSSSPTFTRPTPTPAPTFISHTVVAGDTLVGLARAYETTGRSIAYWNRAAYPSLDPDSPTYDPNRIEIGWVLQVQPGAEVDPSTLPTPTPGVATPTAAASSSPPAASPTPGSTGPATAISHGPRTSNQVALTLDMGGRLDPALDIMEWLIDHEVKATIFPTGQMGTTTATGRAVLRAMADHPELFALGNHSWDHPDFRSLTAAQMRDQVVRAEDAIRPLAGSSTRPWFRPPYGGWNATVQTGVGAAGWSKLVIWDVDTIDWRPVADGGPTAGDITAKVLANAQGGSIVLMHLGGFNTLEALPGIVDGLRARGFELVTLDQMLG